MKIGDLVRAKHPFLVGSLGIVVQFSESYSSIKPTGHSDICIQWCVADGRRSWTNDAQMEVISEYR
jgi:hypothetical protein